LQYDGQRDARVTALPASSEARRRLRPGGGQQASRRLILARHKVGWHRHGVRHRYWDGRSGVRVD